MQPPGSVSQWVGELKAGNHAAAQRLWERYFARLVELARRRLDGTNRRAADEEDVALSAFASFCRRAAQGRFPQLQDRDDLWQLLVTITARKAIKLRERNRRLKRSGGLDGPSVQEIDLEQVIGSEPTPDFAAEVAEECERLLGCLEEELRSVARWKMEGFTNQEIAQMLGCVERSVERRLLVIRTLWEEEIHP